MPIVHSVLFIVWILYLPLLNGQDTLHTHLITLPLEEQITYLEERMRSAFYNDPTSMHRLVSIYDSIVVDNQLNEKKFSVLTFQGNAYYTNQQYGLALEKYLEAQTLLEEGTDLLAYQNLYNNIAACYRFSSEGDRSITYYKKALDIAIELKDTTLIAQTSNNLGMQLLESDSLEEAAPHLDKAVLLYQYLNSPIFEGISKLTRANLNNQLGNFQLAIIDYQNAMTLVPEPVAPIVHAAAYAGIGSIYRKTKKYDQANTHLNISLQKAEAIQHTEQIKESNRELSELYEALGDYKMSMSYFKAYTIAKDSLFTAEQHQTMTDAFSKYEVESKNQEIALLSEKEKVNSLKLTVARRKNLAYGVGITLLGLLSVTLVQFYNKIKTKNFLISKALKEKEILLKEIHHRVKNNLHFVSSLLGLQTEHITDATALNALQEGQNRVQSMALIHQNLYQEDNLTGVAVDDYFDKLITSLFDSYNIKDEQISLSKEISPLNLDVDTLIPIGLILNELISNCLKYAFPQGRTGMIKVVLQERQEQLYFAVIDDGVGFSNINPEGLGDSFGFQLINALKQQLRAILKVDTSGGTKVEMWIKRYQKAME
jgi:two-component system, sensor histidine kinase PdtaS